MRYSEQWKLGNTRSRSQKKNPLLAGFFLSIKILFFVLLELAARIKNFPQKKFFARDLIWIHSFLEKKPQNHFIPIPKKSVI
tara:strand:- start:641 stop:886 length:246 start_codon:yes stop_codon:yes gene_type:complete